MPVCLSLSPFLPSSLSPSLPPSLSAFNPHLPGQRTGAIYPQIRTVPGGPSHDVHDFLFQKGSSVGGRPPQIRARITRFSLSPTPFYNPPKKKPPWFIYTVWEQILHFEVEKRSCVALLVLRISRILWAKKTKKQSCPFRKHLEYRKKKSIFGVPFPLRVYTVMLK